MDYFKLCKNGIRWTVRKGQVHTDELEMAGFYTSDQITYGVGEGGVAVFGRYCIFPTLRTIPNNTHASLRNAYRAENFPVLLADGEGEEEKAVSFTLDGMLTAKTKTSKYEIIREFFPTELLLAAVERTTVKNITDKPVRLTLSTPEVILDAEVRGTKGMYQLEVLHDAVVEVHVSGHACQEELKLMQALIKPKYFMPIHGENRHMAANRELARFMGMKDHNIFLSEIGKVLEIDSKGARFAGTVPAGQVLVDGYGVGDVGNIVLRDRKHLSQDGLIVVVATVDEDSSLLLSGPDIVSRGFVYVRENEELMEEAKRVVQKSLERCLGKGKNLDRMHLKNTVRDDLSKFLFTKTGRKPMILPVIMNI